jgi:hypothetical protein
MSSGYSPAGAAADSAARPCSTSLTPSTWSSRGAATAMDHHELDTDTGCAPPRPPAATGIATVRRYDNVDSGEAVGQEPSIWIEVAKAIPSVVTAITAIVGVSIAARGLNKWRTETIGKRKAELAEEVLADFYQARDILTGVRSPGRFSHEGTTRVKVEGETEDDTRILNAYFTTVERLKNESEFFARFFAHRFRFVAHFGPEAGAPYDELKTILTGIISAAHMLVITYRRDGALPPSHAKWEAMIGWSPLDNDEIPARINAIVATIERICQPAIQEVRSSA